MASIFRRKPRLIWLLAHVVINVYYSVLIFSTNRLYGETNVVQIGESTPIFFILVLLVMSFVYFNLIVFNFSYRIFPISFRVVPSQIEIDRIGILILVLQISFAAYSFFSGSRLAGSGASDASLISQIWVLIPIDVIFLLYYGAYRDEKYFKYNLGVNLVSNLLRGWFGIVLTIVFIESCQLVRKRRLTFPRFLAILFACVVAYPVLYFGKIFVRYYAFLDDVTVDGFLSQHVDVDVISLLEIAISQIGNRIQLISSAISTYELSTELERMVMDGNVYPFWAEGLHSLAFDRLFSEPHKLDIGQAIANILDPFSLVENWNSNPTFIGWFFVLPYFCIFHVIYGTGLVLVSSLAFRMVSGNEISKDIFWYMVLVLLIPGWYGAFVLFTYSCVLFLIMHLLVAKFRVPR
ncbi:oligosaccharide repeat unit polymerase [Propionivibrio dicarboxylicus]|uniref:oligosaccharide repeat unit polymerase n=1 Tax=Propionivibrio dicarboxylicus TaxID=83767 RepID=UPI00115FDC1E|nr:oligosaccharide repeat unit polymerase [Propionivibrio dicarboxylicus]